MPQLRLRAKGLPPQECGHGHHEGMPRCREGMRDTRVERGSVARGAVGRGEQLLTTQSRGVA